MTWWCATSQLHWQPAFLMLLLWKSLCILCSCKVIGHCLLLCLHLEWPMFTPGIAARCFLSQHGQQSEFFHNEHNAKCCSNCPLRCIDNQRCSSEFPLPRAWNHHRPTFCLCKAKKERKEQSQKANADQTDRFAFGCTCRLLQLAVLNFKCCLVWFCRARTKRLLSDQTNFGIE